MHIESAESFDINMQVDYMGFVIGSVSETNLHFLMSHLLLQFNPDIALTRVDSSCLDP